MIDTPDDDRDPLRAAFDNHQRAPREEVPRHTVEHSVDDLRRLADGTATVTLTHYEFGEDGITRHVVENVTITEPFTHPRKEIR
jgi:hypothetical protein